MNLKTQGTTITLYEVSLVISQNDIISNVPVYVGLTESGHLQGSAIVLLNSHAFIPALLSLLQTFVERLFQNNHQRLLSHF